MTSVGVCQSKFSFVNYRLSFLLPAKLTHAIEINSKELGSGTAANAAAKTGTVKLPDPLINPGKSDES